MGADVPIFPCMIPAATVEESSGFFCSAEKLTEILDCIAMGPRALAASSGLTPWSMAAEGNNWNKSPKMGVRGARPHGLPPPAGERGGDHHNFP